MTEIKTARRGAGQANAVGGEVFALFLPAFYYIISQAVGDIAADMKKHQGGKDHEKTC